MQRIYTTLLFAGCFSCALNAQQTREVRTENSGVIVHESSGVEGFQKVEAKPVISQSGEKDINTLNLSQCIDAAAQIKLKVEKFPDTAENKERRANYSEKLIQIEERIKLLTNASK